MWLILRRTSQAAILALFLIGPLYDIWIIKGNLSSSLLLDTVPMTDPLLTLQIIATGGELSATLLWGTFYVVLFYALAGGRVFCSWVCPVNPVTDLASWLRRKFHIKGGARLNRRLRYWVLGMVLTVSLITGVIVWEAVNPVSILHRGLFFGMGAGWTVILGIFLFDLLFAERGWCSHLCPMGATYSLIGHFSPLRIRTEAEKCDGCDICYYICPEPQVLPPAIKKGGDIAVRGGECTNCGRCIDTCPQNVFRFGALLNVRGEKS